VQDPAGGIAYYGYDELGNRVSLTDQRGHTAYFGYDALSRLTSEIDPLGAATYHSYDATGNLTCRTDDSGQTTYFSHDPAGRQSSTTDRLGHTTYYRCDATGRRTVRTNALAASTYLHYDAAGRLEAVVDPLGGEERSAYDGSRNRLVSVSADGVAVYFRYDALGRLSATVDALGCASYCVYDPRGNRTADVDALGHASYFGFDAAGRKAYEVDALGNARYYTYDTVGNRVLEVDARGYPTYYAVDGLARVVSVTDAADSTTYFCYDSGGNLASLSDARGGVSYYAYDARGSRTSVRRADSTCLYYRYDALGPLASMCDERGWSYFGHDAELRLTEISTPDGRATQLGYDAVGRLVCIGVTGLGAAYCVYDQADRMISAQAASGELGTAYYEYSPSGKVLVRTAGNGCFSYFRYDQVGRLAQVLNCFADGTPLAYFEYEFDADSRVVSCAHEDGTTVYYGHDSAGQLIREEWRDAVGAQLYSFEWDYDPAGNRARETRGQSEAYYSYDELGSLTHLVRDGAPTYFAYDACGNCVAISEPGGTTYFSYGSDCLVRSIVYPNGVANYFHYDALSGVYAVADSSGLSYFTWEPFRPDLQAEHDAAGSVRTEYSNGVAAHGGAGGTVSIRRVIGGAEYFLYPMYDGRGSAVSLVDAAQDVVTRRSYDAWGTVLGRDETGPNSRLGYRSPWLQLQDSDDRMLISKARVYRADLGRFLQRDPIRTDANPYSYGHNDPLGRVDVHGLSPSLSEDIIAAICRGESLAEKVLPAVQALHSALEGAESALPQWVEYMPVSGLEHVRTLLGKAADLTGGSACGIRRCPSCGTLESTGWGAVAVGAGGTTRGTVNLVDVAIEVIADTLVRWGDPGELAKAAVHKLLGDKMPRIDVSGWVKGWIDEFAAIKCCEVCFADDRRNRLEGEATARVFGSKLVPRVPSQGGDFLGVSGDFEGSVRFVFCQLTGKSKVKYEVGGNVHVRWKLLSLRPGDETLRFHAAGSAKLLLANLPRLGPRCEEWNTGVFCPPK
jgi:RHS repeat-associated protein